MIVYHNLLKLLFFFKKMNGIVYFPKIMISLISFCSSIQTYVQRPSIVTVIDAIKEIQKLIFIQFYKICSIKKHIKIYMQICTFHTASFFVSSKVCIDLKCQSKLEKKLIKQGLSSRRTF